MTPHLGANTMEEGVTIEIAKAIFSALQGELDATAVNAPTIPHEVRKPGISCSFKVVAYTHVMHLTAQACVRYAMENSSSYVHSNIVGLVNLLEVCKFVNPQPEIIFKSKLIPIFEAPNHGTVARDFTYIGDIVKGCLASLDTAERSTGNGGKKKGPAQLRVFNFGNTSPVPVTDLVSILERLLKCKGKRTMLKLLRNEDMQMERKVPP